MKCEPCRDLYFRSAVCLLYWSIIIVIFRAFSLYFIFNFFKLGPRLVWVFSQYCEVGILLIATETALSQSLCLKILAFN